MSDHAIANAKAWAETIEAYHQAAQFCDGDLEGRDINREAKGYLRQHGYDGDNVNTTLEAITEALQEMPLSVLVRAGWCSPGETAEPEEFEILLSTGGPALRIVGELGAYNSPKRPQLQWQDWGTPWSDYDACDSAALEWFCSLFYFGD